MFKEHKKLYKAGKNWVAATITVAAISFMGGVTAHADSNEATNATSAQPDAQTTNQTEQVESVQNKTVTLQANSNDEATSVSTESNVQTNDGNEADNQKDEQQQIASTTTSNTNKSSSELDPNIYGTVNVKDWDYKTDNNIINLTNYHGQDTRHIIIPNLNDFSKAGVDVANKDGAGINSNLEQSLKIDYIDEMKLVKQETLTGKSGETINLTSYLHLPTGYQFNHNFPPKLKYTFKASGDSMIIDLEHIINNISVTTPIDQLPAGIKPTDLHRQVVRSITINVPSQKPIVIIQKVDLTRQGSYDQVTKKITYTNWTTGKFKAYTAPVIEGYFATQPFVNSLQVDHDTDDQFVVINYIANIQYGNINYVDENGKTVKSDSISGTVGTTIDIKISLPTGYELANKNEQVPTTVKVNENGIQDVVIKVKKIAPLIATNQVPQDKTTQNNQLNFNQGWLDNYGLTQNINGQSQIKASGWHAVGLSNQDSYRYMIIFDNTLGHEIARQKLTPAIRNDVRQAYSNVNNSNNSGFNMTIDIPNDAVNHSLSLVARYSNDAINGEGQHVDYWFGPLKMNETNQAYLDSIKSDGKTVTVSGWHATNQAAGRPYHYIIAFDQTLGHEIARQEVKAVQRPDVAKVYGTIANAVNAGFSTSFNLTAPYFNDNIQFLSRYTDDPSGNGNSVDYWFNPVNHVNRANLDSVDLSNGRLKVAGWHATDLSQFEPNHFLIVFDNTTGRQVASQKVALEDSPDVARVYSDTKTAGHSRFNFDFGSLNLQPGHTYSLVSRYSADGNGNGNDGAHTDSWMNMGILNQSAYNLDNTVLSGNTLTFQGWRADDQSMVKHYAYAILLQNGKEIGRQRLNQIERDDVAKVYPSIYQSKNSGFKASFKLPTVSLDNLQLVLRNTDDPNGNGNNPSDVWINVNRNMIRK
ncbi:mucin-binding protein [Limosilactobacillus caviae]|uniref:mucin-binding protein n=2 Tax=Limosilactobacillus caviae TaxID=1769424 RepID=UPI00129B67BF|nr:hypothetical protein [Limosilactobacillus reuteri]